MLIDGLDADAVRGRLASRRCLLEAASVPRRFPGGVGPMTIRYLLPHTVDPAGARPLAAGA